MRVHLLERSQRVEVPVDRAFAFYADARNLEPLTPPWLHFEVTTPRPISMASGTLLDYRLGCTASRSAGGPGSIPGSHRPASPTPGHGPLRALGAHPHLRARRRERTIIRDQVRYAIPFGPLGTLAHRLFVRRDLERIFDYRRDAVAASIALPQ